ncbi:MAG: VOC family protein [Woeseiaceae bacterium]
MSQLHLQIDHIGLLAPEINALAAEFRGLGFTIVGPTELTSIDEEGRRIGLGQHSAHVMFGNDYIELTAVDMPAPEHHLAHFLRPPWGMRLLLPRCDDIGRVHARCEARQLNPSPVYTAARKLDYYRSAEARFNWFALPTTEWPDVLLAYVQHLTPELVFDPRVCQHENGARGLTRLYYVADVLPTKYGLLASAGGHVIELVTPAMTNDVLGFDVRETTPFAGIRIAVADIEAAETRLRSSYTETRPVAKGLSVQLECGVCLVFEQAAGE